MLNPLGFLTWKIGTIAAGIIALSLVGALTLSKIEAHRLRVERNTLFDDIHNEATGYVVRLATSRNSVLTLETSITEQNIRIAELEIESANRIAESAQQIDAARADALAAQSRVAAILARPIVSAGRCDRVEEVDLRILEALGQ
jgi:hypothetical protein